jgi:plasmid replication initiation protein
MNKPYDDSNWREEYKGYTSNEKHLELLENGPKSLSQSWILQALYNEWKKIKGYNKLDPKENEGQLQSSMGDFFKKQDEYS